MKEIKVTNKEDIIKKLAGSEPDKIAIGFLVGEEKDDFIEVSDVVVPPQKRGYTSAEVPGKDKLWLTRKDIVGMVTYHADFPPFESATTFEAAKHINYRRKIVINAKGEMKQYK